MLNKKISFYSLNCPICKYQGNNISLFKLINDISYFECLSCGSIFADFAAISAKDSIKVVYDDKYWDMEIRAARARSFGSSISRCAEVFLYSRIPIKKFLDIGTGSRLFLDAISVLMPDYKKDFYGVELYPPPAPYRTENSNYFIGDISSMPVKISAGMCIEVIEHMHPDQLDEMLSKLASISEPNGLFIFNSGQPEYVKKEDPGYLDPFKRGHIVSYSLKGISLIFAKHGFTVIPLPGRTWAFLAEYNKAKNTPNADELLNRIWHALPENVEKLKNNGFGELMYCMGIESARCYLESAISEERTQWALSLQRQI